MVPAVRLISVRRASEGFNSLRAYWRDIVEDEFSFLLLRHSDNGLVFVALDSVVGYIRYLSRELAHASEEAIDPATATAISKAFDLLSDRIEEIESGRGTITDI